MTATHAQSVQRANNFATILVVLLAAVAVACGIGFSEEEPVTETFKAVRFEGSLVPGGPVTIFVDYAQQYPVKLLVRCDLLSVEDIPTVTPPPTDTVSPLSLRRTPRPTLPRIPRVEPTPKNKVMEILGTTLGPNEVGGPVGEATPVLGTIKRRFLAPSAGDYMVWCYTPNDLNNAVFEELTIPPPEAELEPTASGD